MMRHIHLGRRAAVSNSALLVVTLVVGLSACGGSSRSHPTGKALTGTQLSGAAASKAPRSTSSKPPDPKQVARLSQFAACMRKHGVQLPAPEVSAAAAVTELELLFGAGPTDAQHDQRQCDGYRGRKLFDDEEEQVERERECRRQHRSAHLWNPPQARSEQASQDPRDEEIAVAHGG